jgi:hypothetical protein
MAALYPMRPAASYTTPRDTIRQVVYALYQLPMTAASFERSDLAQQPARKAPRWFADPLRDRIEKIVSRGVVYEASPVFRKLARDHSGDSVHLVVGHGLESFELHVAAL